METNAKKKKLDQGLESVELGSKACRGEGLTGKHFDGLASMQRKPAVFHVTFMFEWVIHIKKLLPHKTKKTAHVCALAGCSVIK